MDEEIKEVGEMATIEGEEEISIEEDYTTLEAETIIIDDDSNIQTDAEYEQAVAQKELADEAREALSAVLLSVLEKGEINDDDIAEIAAQQEIYTENVTALKILGITTEDGKSTTNVITSNIDYDELIKVLSEKADWLYIDEDGQVMLNGEVVPKLKVVELEAEKIKADVGEFKNLTAENLTAVNAKIDNLKVTDLTAINAEIENLKANKANIEYLEANYATIENLNATNADINNLKANKADIEYLDANYATINLLNTNIASINTALIDKANVSDLNATNANITNLQATKANITDLNAAKANITTLTSNLADITTLVNGNLTSDNIQSMVITGDKFTVANGFIKNAMIDSISANKINTGTINTNNVKIQSADGSMVINGTTQQFKDKNNKVRIQIGKDAQGNFTFALFSQDGVGVLIDETGIKSGAVPNGLIVNDMVSNNANISGSKLDINSVVSSINNGTTTIKGTKIQLDEQGQSLQVAFSQLKSKVETIENVTIDGDLSSVIEQVTTNTTNINTMQGQISSLISNTTITKANGEVVQLKDEYNSTKNTVNSHSTKIGSLETNLATTNNNISSVSSKQTALEQNLNGFKQTVSDTYTTKAEFNGLQIGGTNLYPNSNFKTQPTYTEQAAGSRVTWDSSVDEGNVTTKYNGKMVQLYDSQGTSSNSKDVYLTFGQTVTLQPNTTYTLSFDYYSAGAFARSSSYIYLWKTKGNASTRQIIALGVTNNSKNRTRLVKTFTTDSEHLIFQFRIGFVNTGACWVAVDGVKLEKGNRATGWSPAPQDVDTSIATVDGKFANYSTTSAMNSAINQKANEITSSVSNTYATKASVTDVSNNLKNNYSTTSAMNSAINQKANEITSSVSQTYATKTSLKATDDKFANYSTTSQMNSAINQKGDSILSTVSNTYTTKADFNNLDIGGRNFLAGTKNAFTRALNTANNNNNFTTNDPYTTYNSQTLSSLGLKVGDKITVSFDWNLSNVTTAGNFRVETVQDSTYKSLISGPHNFGSNTSGRYVGTKVLTDVDININKIRIRVDASNFTITIKNMKLEKGNKDTSWSPALEDIDASITAVDSKFTNYSTTSQMNSAINQKANEITSSVSNTYATKAALNTVDGKFANYSTTSAMNTAIKQKADSITQSVSNTYATKTALNSANNNITSLTNRMSNAESKLTKDSLTTTIGNYYTTSTDVNSIITNKGYATTSQVTQTATDLTAKFSSSGGYNLIENSSGYFDVTNWYHAGDANKLTRFGVNNHIDGYKNFTAHKSFYATTTDTNEKFIFSKRFPLKPNTKYTLSGVLSANAQCKGIDVYMVQSESQTEASNEVYTPAARFGANTWWKKFTYTFTTGANVLSGYLRIDNNGSTTSGTECYIYFGDLLLEEGSVAHPWSPHPSEVRSGITQIDANGIKVFHNSIDSNSYTHMSPSGFYIKNKGTDIFKVDTNGLYLKGRAEITSGSMPSSLLTGTIDNARLNSTIVNGATNGTSAKSTLDNKASGWDSTKTAVDNNKTNWSNAYNRVVQWASGSVAGSTTINGGLIQTGTITAKQLYLGDLTNYCNLREETASLYGFTAEKIDNWGTWYKLNNNQRDICISGNKSNDYGYYKCLGGESFRIKFEVKSNVKGSSTNGGSDSVYCGVNIGLYGKLGDGSNFYQIPTSGYVGNANSTEGHINVWTTLPANARTFGVFLQLSGWGNWSGTCRIKNVQVFRMSSGELIVDGSITADKIAANAITGKTITGGTINGSIFKSGTDYNPNKQNITGLQMLDDTIYSYGTKNNGMYAVTKISGGTLNIGNGADGAGLNWSTHISSSDISLFKQGSSGYFYVGTTNAPGSGYSTTTTTIDTTTINIGSKNETTAFKVDYNDHCEFGNNYFTRGSLTINQLSQGAAKGTQTYLSGTTISATNIYQNGSSVSGSDIILKDNIKEYEDSALDIINKTKVYSFNRILANQDKTEIGFLAQQVPDIFVFDKGEFTAEELEGLTAQEKQQLLDKKTKEHRTVLENKKLDEIADKVASFYDLNDEQTEAQISQIMDEYENIEYEVPISTINQNNIIAIMFKAIQELKAELDEVKKFL